MLLVQVNCYLPSRKKISSTCIWIVYNYHDTDTHDTHMTRLWCAYDILIMRIWHTYDTLMWQIWYIDVYNWRLWNIYDTWRVSDKFMHAYDTKVTHAKHIYDVWHSRDTHRTIPFVYDTQYGIHMIRMIWHTYDSRNITYICRI